MFKSTFKIILLNSVLFVVMFFLYFFTGFSLGYGSGDGHPHAALILYTLFAAAHLLINYFFILRSKKYQAIVIVASYLYILMLYGITAYIYR